jgi:hypothetical protein
MVPPVSYDHPILPCGYNADDNNGDEVDGAGTNWPIWPAYFVSFQLRNLLILSPDTVSIFETDCPDYVVPCANNTVTIPREVRAVKFRSAA